MAASGGACGLKDKYVKYLYIVKPLVSCAQRDTPGTSYTMGAHIAHAPWSASNIDTFNEMVGTNAKIVHWFQDWANNGAFQRNLFDAVYQRGAMPMLTMEPWDYSAGTNQTTYQLQDITGGQHDALIRNFAQASAAYGRPYYLRFAHEMNGNWTSWSPGVNGNNGGPAEYAQAFRHVHDIFEQEGATNVRWVWCPNVNRRLSELEHYYPGDAYVDWTCMDGYNWGTTNSEGWQSMSQVFGATYDQVTQVAPTKPVMIGETASTELGGNKAAWIEQGYYNDLPNSLPRVRAVVWFHENRETDWRVNSSQASLDAYKEVAASSRYQGTLP
jgi:beta-mannanase